MCQLLEGSSGDCFLLDKGGVSRLRLADSEVFNSYFSVQTARQHDRRESSSLLSSVSCVTLDRLPGLSAFSHLVE